jgi:hypothetical protein
VTEPIEADDLPDGAIAMALTIVETNFGRGIEASKETFERLAEAVRLGAEVWGEDALVKGFAALIYVGVGIAKDEIEYDLLQTMIPAIVGGLREDAEELDLSREMLATAAGLLTAASLRRMPYEWRISLGPIVPGEPMMFCYTACGVVQYVDENVFGQPGRFAEVMTIGLATDRS